MTTPFETLYGRQPPNLTRFLSNEIKMVIVTLELSERDETLNQLKAHLARAQAQMKKYTDKKRRDVQFEAGEWVFFKLRPHRQQSVVRRINQKLVAHIYGPFQVIAKMGEVAYKLQFPSNSKIHPVFHVSQLKKEIGDYDAKGELPVELEITEKDGAMPEAVVRKRIIYRERSPVQQSLITGKDSYMEDVTWEDDTIMPG